MTQITLREYLRATEDAISSGRVDEAMASCQSILTYFPEALEAQRLLGEVYLAQGQLEEAQQTFEWILTNDPENVIVYCDRALISERVADADTALDCYQQAYELSRGNKNIRQEFNQLSARSGQQEFMFSRAGLARLYMRGDLLTQAAQEWEAVLAVSPERLDARLGLMETHWREGIYEKVEQIANQLLEEIPTCLKALLFLAHITSISNLARARELLQRAESLDPELAMAQELFADLAASQPNDPFLEMIKKESVLLENGIPVTANELQRASVDHLNGNAQAADTPTSHYGGWEHLTNATDSLVPETPGTVSRQTDAKTLSALTPVIPTDLDAQPGAQAEADQPWYQRDQLTTANASQSWEKVPSADLDQENWQEEEQPAHPAWLDTLTRSEQHLPAEAIPLTPSQPVEQTSTSPVPEQQKDRAPVRMPQEQPALADEPLPFFTSDESESEIGWPEWLKSLGAESLEPEQMSPTEFSPVVPPTMQTPTRQETQPQLPTQSQPLTEADPWAALPDLSMDETSAQTHGQHGWMQQLETPQMSPMIASHPPTRPQPEPVSSAPFVEEEQRYITSLADLEKGLQAQGFTPLAPGSLASIAQTQATLPEKVPPQAPQQEPSLSSALAQLGNFSQAASQGQAANEPWWNTSIAQVREQAQQAISNEPVNPFTALGANVSSPAQGQISPVPPTPGQAQQVLTPTYRADTLLDNDLETTMKRPAVKLQPMQHGVQKDRPYSSMRSERRLADHSEDSNMSSHEHLVRGYQYQLNGAYDDAMVEYRLIIRNAPELLDDVISNVRALLKLNPSFSQGYRVLGDAYMRRGEYLQAMEAYNKALTMAKKARG